MDERIREHARVLVEWSARVEAGDTVVVSVDEDAHELAVAVAEQLGRVGATPIFTYDSGEVSRAYLRAHKGEFAAPDHISALLDETDVYLSLRGGRNTSATADVPNERRRAYNEAHSEVREDRLDTRWVSTVHPNRSLAQQAGMALEEYQEFAYAAILRDWESLAEQMALVKARLDDTAEVRITKEGTDLTMQVGGRVAVNSAASVAYDSHNLPSGEVFTAPYATEGEVVFDVPMTVRGDRLKDVRLVFEGGEVVDYSAAQGESTVQDIIETDDGARRLGELGIGMNRGIDRFTDNILFDEKMGDTVHLALGRAYSSNVPEGATPPRNESAVHVDLITEMHEGSTMWFDDEVVQRDGRFWFEE